jgi:hypothetical protein
VTAPITSIPVGQTSSYTLAQQLNTYTELDQFPEFLAALETVIVYIDPNQNVFHLNGTFAGMEGVRIGETIQGEQHIPFSQVLIEGAFQVGSTIQRTNYEKRLINFRIQIGGTGFNNYTYRMAEDRWWAGQVENKPGWLGVFTRLSGWRWIQVWPYRTVDTAVRQDPVAYGNNYAVWDINWIAPYPFYSKPAVWKQWTASTAGAKHSDGFYYGNLVLANRGDVDTYIYYLITGAGYAKVQDNNSDSLVALPIIEPSDGTVLCNTDPAQRTLLAQNDPQDDFFFKIARASGILNFFLSGVADAGIPIWQRGYTRFLYTTPGQTVTHFTVAHTNPAATITAFLPQRYRRAR